MRLAKQHTGRREFIALTHCFHGRTYRHPLDHRQHGPQEPQRPLHVRRDLRPGAYSYRYPLNTDVSLCELAWPSAAPKWSMGEHTISNDVAAFIVEAGLGRRRASSCRRADT